MQKKKKKIATIMIRNWRLLVLQVNKKVTFTLGMLLHF